MISGDLSSLGNQPDLRVRYKTQLKRRRELWVAEYSLKEGMINFRRKMAHKLLTLSASAGEPGSLINTPRTLVHRVAFWHLYDEVPDRKLMALILWKQQLTRCKRSYHR